MSKLALLGGEPVRQSPFPAYNSIGAEEKRAALEVLDSGVLSQYLGVWHDDFYGGPRVQRLEREWEAFFGVRHAVSVNSATSGLYAALGAAGIGPGDEVIAPPFTMIASITGALLYGAIPVFADLLPETFCIDPASVRRRITPRTKAIVAVDLFGHPAEFDELQRIAKEHSLTLIEDCAQAPAARYRGRLAGTLGHIGVFSLNYHKHIHSGEGGVVVTDDAELADRVQLIRNHAEAVVAKKGTTNLANLVGFNFRMTELEAAIASEQLKKLERLALPRVELGAELSRLLAGFDCLVTPAVRPECTHVYYMYSLRYFAEKSGLSRELLVKALNAEGIPFGAGYVKPIYLEPMYQQRIAIGKHGWPFTNPEYRGALNYEKGLCPVTEALHEREIVHTRLIHSGLTPNDIRDVARAFDKVLSSARELASHEGR